MYQHGHNVSNGRYIGPSFSSLCLRTFLPRHVHVLHLLTFNRFLKMVGDNIILPFLALLAPLLRAV